MNKEFIPYEQALALKSHGFDEPCFGWYDSECQETLNYDHTHNSCGWLLGNHCTAPTYSQAFRWFREKHGLNCYIDRGGMKGIYHAFVGGSEHGFLYGNNGNSPSEFTYEEAELATLNKLIQIIKNK